MALAEESEYAAWLIYNRYYLNHFTISVHRLRGGYRTIEHFNNPLGRHEFRRNNAGGKIKVNGDCLLKQSSTVTELGTAKFAGDEGSPVAHEIPGSYIECAERLPRPEFSNTRTEDYLDLNGEIDSRRRTLTRFSKTPIPIR